MKVLVCGGRDFEDSGLIQSVLSAWDISELIEGGARGADRLARQYAEGRGIPVTTFRAAWDEHGKYAGVVRNAQMLSEGCPDEVIAFPGGRGTENMINQARKAGVPVTVVEI